MRIRRSPLAIQRQGKLGETLQRFGRNKLAVTGAVILVILVLVALFAPVLAPYAYDAQDSAVAKQGPSLQHWFGTDNYGRDIFSRCIYGARISLTVGIVAVSVAIIAGGLLGAVAAFYSGVVDDIIMRILDIVYAVPAMLLGIAIAATLGASLQNMMIAIAVGNVPSYARIVRASVLTVKDNEYIEAARCVGASDWRIIFKHILPNALAPIIVQATLGVAGAILSCSTLSFLGLGIKPPTPEWGSMLSTARQFIRQCPYMSIFPGVCIMITVFALNVVGDGIRDAIDPRLKD
ncbi:MAG: ABC transporter permease [Oscillospiraceae bacterium]|nr:ABC transporter permease [Oscillospiraceae bacterium]